MNLQDHMTTMQAAGHAMGTKVSEYIESKVPRQCGMCNHMVADKLCNQSDVLRDPEVRTDKDTGLKIVEPLLGCCRFWKPKANLKKQS